MLWEATASPDNCGDITGLDRFSWWIRHAWSVSGLVKPASGRRQPRTSKLVGTVASEGIDAAWVGALVDQISSHEWLHEATTPNEENLFGPSASSVPQVRVAWDELTETAGSEFARVMLGLAGLRLCAWAGLLPEVGIPASLCPSVVELICRFESDSGLGRTALDHDPRNHMVTLLGPRSSCLICRPFQFTDGDDWPNLRAALVWARTLPVPQVLLAATAGLSPGEAVQAWASACAQSDGDPDSGQVDSLVNQWATLAALHQR